MRVLAENKPRYRGLLYSPRDLAGTQATGAGVDTTRCAVDNRLDALDVGLPSAIGASV